MLGSTIPMMLFCTSRIALDGFLGLEGLGPDAGLCGGTSGFDCVCPPATDFEVNASMQSLDTNTEVEHFEAWYAGLEAPADSVHGCQMDKSEKKISNVEMNNQEDLSHVTHMEVAQESRPPSNKENLMNNFVPREQPQHFSDDAFIAMSPAASVIERSANISTEDIEKYCVDKSDKCEWWKSIGECEKNPSYLFQNCPKTCGACLASLPREVRCARDPSFPPLVQSPGGLTNLFESIINNQTIKDMYNTTVLSRDPYLLTFDNFATRSDWDAISGMLEGKFEGSTVVDKPDENGNIGRQHLNTRTSRNAWCMQPPCLTSNAHLGIRNRLARLLGAPATHRHMEALQVLKYEEGQYYHPHHDTITEQINMMSGPRMLTAFMYFSDVEGGGETEFTNLGLKVTPKVGRMVLWPSQKDEDSLVVDHRTTHQACNVTSGLKEAANVWVHLYDYESAHILGCAG
eukprot:m.885900 g.885900  ORF g.885900 m.885900 type:complete len:459 (+) comp23622_c0_seq28:178-1554(+)